MERDLQVQLRAEDEEVDHHQELLVLQGDGGVACVHHFLDHLKGRGGLQKGQEKTYRVHKTVGVLWLVELGRDGVDGEEQGEDGGGDGGLHGVSGAPVSWLLADLWPSHQELVPPGWCTVCRPSCRVYTPSAHLSPL